MSGDQLLFITTVLSMLGFLVFLVVTLVRRGITGDALDAREGEPGPFYIQGDHSGGLEFRNITVSTPKS